MAWLATALTARTSAAARTMILSGRMRVSPDSAGARTADPQPRERQRRNGINEPGRHPHDESGELLVFERGQSPFGRERRLARIPEVARDRQKDAEDAGVEGGDKEVEHRRAIAAPPRPPVHQRPPEQERGE